MTQTQNSISAVYDPRQIPQIDFPFHFILSNQATSLIAWAINWKTRSNYDHMMQSINEGNFITQDFGGYHEIKMDQYLKKGGELKFVTLRNANDNFNVAFRSAILNRLDQPWYKKLYDFGNIFGRAIGFPWLHIPGTYDCSEISLYIVKQCAVYLPKPDCDIIMAIPNTASPDDIDQAIKDNPNVFKIYGEWQSDEGVVV